MFRLKTSRLLAVLLIIGGVFCILFPVVASVSASIFAGVALLFAAFFALFQFPYCAGTAAKLLNVVMFLLYLIAGYFLMFNPLEGTLALATLVGIFMLIESGFSFVAWGRLRDAKNAVLILINAIATLILGVIFLLNPEASYVLLGILIGLNLLFTGVSSLAWTTAD